MLELGLWVMDSLRVTVRLGLHLWLGLGFICSYWSCTHRKWCCRQLLYHVHCAW